MSVTRFRSVCRVFLIGFLNVVVTATRPDLGHRWHASQWGAPGVTSAGGHLGTEPSGWSNSGKSQLILIRGQFVLQRELEPRLQILCRLAPGTQQSVTFWKKKNPNPLIKVFTASARSCKCNNLAKSIFRKISGKKNAKFSPLFAVVSPPKKFTSSKH